MFCGVRLFGEISSGGGGGQYEDCSSSVTYPEVLIKAKWYHNDDYCTDSNPCVEGFGDCDYDSNCAGSLECAQRDYYTDTTDGLTDFENSGGGDGIDYCYDPSVSTITQEAACDSSYECSTFEDPAFGTL